MTDQHRHDTRLDRFVDSYSERTNGMRVSAVRALFAVANRPEIVSLAGGMPNIKDLPLPEIAGSLEQMIATNGMQVMQYGSGQGEPFMREQIVEVMAEGVSKATGLAQVCGEGVEDRGEPVDRLGGA